MIRQRDHAAKATAKLRANDTTAAVIAPDHGEVVAMAVLGGFPMLTVVWATQWVTPPAWDHVAVITATAVVAAVGGWFAMGWAIRRG